MATIGDFFNNQQEQENKQQPKRENTSQPTTQSRSSRPVWQRKQPQQETVSFISAAEKVAEDFGLDKQTAVKIAELIEKEGVALFMAKNEEQIEHILQEKGFKSPTDGSNLPLYNFARSITHRKFSSEVNQLQDKNSKNRYDRGYAETNGAENLNYMLQSIAHIENPEEFPLPEILQDNDEQSEKTTPSTTSEETPEVHDKTVDVEESKKQNIEKFKKQYQILAPYLDETYDIDLKAMESVAMEIAPHWVKRVRFHDREEFREEYGNEFSYQFLKKEEELKKHIFRVARVCAVTEMALSGKDYSNYSNRQLFNEMIEKAKQILSTELRHNYSEMYKIQRLDNQYILDDTLIQVINKNLSIRYSDDTKLVLALMSKDKEDEKTQEKQTIAEESTPATQANEVKEKSVQETSTNEKKMRTPQQLLELASGVDYMQNLDDMTIDELIALHKHIDELRPRRNNKLSKKEANALRTRISIDKIVLEKLGGRLLTPPYQELKDLEKSGEQILLRDILRQYKQDDKRYKKSQEALQALNDERRKRGFENLEYRFEYLGMPKNKRPDYQQFLFDKFYEMPTEEVLESIGISNLYTLRKNMEKYLASHEADDNKKTFLNLQINQVINSHRETQKQEKKRRQQEANLPIIEAVYNDIKEHALEGNMTEVLNILQRLQPNQLGLVVQMEQYAAEQVKNEQNEEVKAKLEEIDGHISARISELREERNKEKATEQEDKTPETVAETTEQENVNAEPGNRADLYEEINEDNIFNLLFEEPEVIKQALGRGKSLIAFRSMIEEHISEGHISAQAPQLETFYNIAIDMIIHEPDFVNPDSLEEQKKEEVKNLLEAYSVDFNGNKLEHPVYDILMRGYKAQPREAKPQEQITPTVEATPTAEPQSNAEENILNAVDEDTYSMLEQIAKDVFDGYGHFYEAGLMDQPRNRIVRLNRFFENVDIEHDEEWRNIGDTLRQLSNRDTYQKYDGYTAEVLKYELLELARQNAINEILNGNEYDGQGNFLNELGQPIFQDDLKEKIQEKVLDHMEESVITLMLSQAQKENNDRLLEGLEKDETGQLTAQGLEDFQKRALDEITEIGNRDTSRNLTEKIKDFVAFWQNKDETKHKFTIYDSVAFSVVKERCSQVHEDIKNLWNKFTSKTKVGAFASKLYERNKQFNEKLAKDHPKLNILYQYGKGIATSLLVGAVAAKTAPIVMTVYCATMSAKAVKSVYNGYKEYKKQNEENDFWNYCKNNKVQVFGTALVATGTAVGIGADALNGAHFNWANISKGSRLSGAIMMGANSALEEAKKGHYGVAFTRFMTTATTVFLGTNNANASNENVDTGENVNTIEAGQPEASNISNEIIEQANKDVENYAEHITLPNEITDSLNQNDQQSSQTTVSEDIDTESSTSQENQQETNNNTEQQHHNNSEKRDVQAKSAEQIEAERQEAEIASIKESVKFEVPDIEKESDTFADNSSSSASAIGDFTNASDEEIYHVQQIIAPAEDTFDNDMIKDEGPELSSDDNTGKIETESEKSVTEPQKTTEETEAKKDENTDFATATDSGLTGEALFTHTSGDTAISVYENGFFGVETKDGEVTQTWNIRVDENGKPFGSIHTATGERIMTPQQLDYYNRLTSDYLMQNDNPAKDQVFKLYGDIDQVIHPKEDSIVNNQDNETKVTNIEGDKNTSTLPFAIHNEIDPITNQQFQAITMQGEGGFYGSDKDANGNELRSWNITIDDKGIRHATIHDALGAHKMSDEQFTKYMLQTMELRDPQTEALSHTSELINQIMDARIQVDNTNLQYNDTSLFLSTSEDGRSGILWTMNENEAPHFYEVTNGQKVEVDFARACEQQENINKELQKIDAGKFHDQLNNFVADCQMTSAFTNARNLDVYAQEYNQALNLSPAQKTYIADDLSRVTNISNNGILVIEKNGTVTYAYHDPLAQGDIKMVRINSDGTEHPIHSQTGTAQKFFAENKELFTKAGLMNSDFATAAYGEEFSSTVSNTGIDNDKLTKSDNPQGDNNDTRSTNTHSKSSLRASLDSMKARGSSMGNGTGNSYDDFVKGIQEDAYINSRPFNAEELEQKYGLVRPAAVVEEERATRTELAGTVTTSHGVYSFTHAENGLAITSTSATRVMVYNETTQEVHFLIANDGEPPHEMNKDEVRSFLDNVQKSIEAEAITNPENFAKDKVMYLNITQAYFDQHPELTDNNSNNASTATNTATDVEQPVSTNNVDLSNLHIMAATERAIEFGLTDGDTRSVETGQYKGTVVTKAENGWQIRYPEGNSVILKAENGTLSGMFVDSDDKVTNMKPQEVEQYRQAAADAYKNSQTTYGKTSSNTGTHSGRMVGRGNGYI